MGKIEGSKVVKWIFYIYIYRERERESVRKKFNELTRHLPQDPRETISELHLGKSPEWVSE